MESNLLKLSPDEAVVKKYDFSTHVDADEEDFGKEDSLTFTNKRIVRRIVSGDRILQKEVLLNDVNHIECNCDTSYYEIDSPIKNYIWIAGAVFFIMVIALVVAIAEKILALGLTAVCFIVGSIIAFGILISKKELKKTVYLRVSIYERMTNSCVITVEKSFSSKMLVMKFANEIGLNLLKYQTGDSSKALKKE